MQIDPNTWTISQPQPGSKGGKTCLVSSFFFVIIYTVWFLRIPVILPVLNPHWE